MLRASEQQQEVWEQAAQDQGESFNSWACDALDAAAEWPGETQLHRAASELGMLKPKVGGSPHFVAKLEKKASSSGCPFDTPRGTKCKACGKTH